MPILVDALRPHVVPALYQVQSPRRDGLLQAITTGAYTPSLTASGGVSLNFQDPVAIAVYYAADAGRFASASFESMVVALQGLEQNLGTGWCVVQLYYSAFYAMHATLRLLGCSCTFLTAAATSRLVRIVNAVGLLPVQAPTRGLCECSLTGTDVALTPMGGGGGGTHELFWRQVVKEVDALVPKILNGPLPTQDAQDAATRLVDVRSTIVAGAAQSDWLTRVRNDVQYRHGHGLWYPDRLRIAERRRLLELVNGWDADEPRHRYPPAMRAGDLPEFVSACVFLTSVCRGLVLDIGDRSVRRGRSFVDYGPAKLLREWDQ